jgi:hypothetical protein
LRMATVKSAGSLAEDEAKVTSLGVWICLDRVNQVRRNERQVSAPVELGRQCD